MADALKAEGNKAFAAKNFQEAVYVQAGTNVRSVLTGHLLLATSLRRLSSLNQQTTSCTPTAPAHMLPSDSSTRRWKTQTRPLKSSRSGPKAGVARALRFMAKEIL